MPSLPALIVAVAEEAVTAVSSFGANLSAFVAGEAMSRMMERRTRVAREILLEELNAGQRTLHDADQVDELVAIAHRYHRAAIEGAARLNLRLMAQVIAGQAHVGNLVADQFLYYADILASLRREEVILLATMYMQEHSTEAKGPTAAKRRSAAFERTREALVPRLFDTGSDFEACAVATMRTGLVTGASGVGQITCSVSPLLGRLVEQCSLDAALRKEDPDYRNLFGEK